MKFLVTSLRANVTAGRHAWTEIGHSRVIDTLVDTPSTLNMVDLYVSQGLLSKTGLTGSATDPTGNVLGMTSPATGKVIPFRQIALQSSVPMVLPSSGSIGNNGALTGITALPATYAKCYMYFPANAIVTGSAAGMYYVVMSSGTAGTIYNNTYTGGVPTIPASPTPFATTGPGAYTQTTGADLVLAYTTISGGSMGLSGSLYPFCRYVHNNSAGNKIMKFKHGSTTIHSMTNTTSITETFGGYITNRGVANVQVTTLGNNAHDYLGASNSAGVSTNLSLNTAADAVVYFTGQLATATDYLVLDYAILEVMPS